MIGATVLIGVTYVGAEATRQEQIFGKITAAEAKTGFVIALEGSRKGETFKLPPALDAFMPARPGEYRLRSTGETVVNPDYTTTWTVQEKTQRH